MFNFVTPLRRDTKLLLYCAEKFFFVYLQLNLLSEIYIRL